MNDHLTDAKKIIVGKPSCWRDFRRNCVHPEIVIYCMAKTETCEEAKNWKSVKRQLEKGVRGF